VSKAAEAGARFQRLKGWLLPFAAGAVTFALGAAAGVYVTLAAQTASLPFVRENIVAGMAVTDTSESTSGGVNAAPNQYPSTP
jgi:hypothetical protein